jgi:hypothetical protein
MPLDAQGIWQYTGSELASPAPDLLNRLAGSVSSKVAAITAVTTSTIALDPLWTADAANPLSLTRVNGRWLLSAFFRNAAAMALVANTTITVGTVAAAARVPTGLPTLRAAGVLTTPAGLMVIGCQINTRTGVVYVMYPAALASQSGGNIGVGFQLMWDAV